MTNFYSDWFSFKIRRNRISFIFSTACVILITILIYYFGSLKISDGPKFIIMSIFTIPTILASYTLTAQRLRDMNVTGWLSLLWIPVNFSGDSVKSSIALGLYIILCAIPGTEGPNKYGNP